MTATEGSTVKILGSHCGVVEDSRLLGCSEGL